jgi:hypothetical protein
MAMLINFYFQVWPTKQHGPKNFPFLDTENIFSVWFTQRETLKQTRKTIIHPLHKESNAFLGDIGQR